MKNLEMKLKTREKNLAENTYSGNALWGYKFTKSKKKKKV